ncbi:molybdopterin-dependent oxidoreductase [Pseudonocardia sp. ICBG1293]|uniref:molybdopterin-dependent oxidoreductase n=1 Tax=Pseudonocardia sp. ICBG1293 TaxID=2844382 RepID=UPI0027DFFB61|nr:molybdopterin-dependent oxidoreductase [Pseudonocardia sp. ICBG1293]
MTVTPTRTTGSLSRAGAVVTGLLGVGSALAAGDLVAGLASPASSPFLTVGDQFVRLTPEWLKQFAITTFGTADKLALLTGMALVITGLAAAAGLVARRRPAPGLAVVVAMGVTALLTTVAAPAFRPVDLTAPVAALLVGPSVFLAVHAAFVRANRPRRGTTAAVSRRRALGLAGGTAVVSLAAAVAGRLLAAGPPSAGPAALALPPAPPVPSLPPDASLPGTPPWLTPTADFYRIDTALQVPRVDAASWTLRVHGMVERELTLSLADLRARRVVEVPITMVCVSNPVGGTLVSNARFTGVRLADLLAEAGIAPGAQQLLSTSVDGFTTGTPVGVVTDGRDALLAFGMNGAALPVEHGFPVRMVVPGLYGYVSGCKWITDIEVTTRDAATPYWAERGWAREGPVKTQSRIDTPVAGASVPAGRVAVAGTSWAPHGGITRVEVSVDGGPWGRALLGADLGADSWRMWRTEIELVPGEHTLRVRATDRTGTVQTEREQVSIPDGATGRHTVPVTAV